MAFEQRSLECQCLYKSHVVASDRSERLSQQIRSSLHATQVPIEVNWLGPYEDLERRGLRVKELCAARQQFLLGSVVGGAHGGLAADKIQHADGVSAFRCAEARDTTLQCQQVEPGLRRRVHR